MVLRGKTMDGLANEGPYIIEGYTFGKDEPVYYCSDLHGNGSWLLNDRSKAKVFQTHRSALKAWGTLRRLGWSDYKFTIEPIDV